MEAFDGVRTYSKSNHSQAGHPFSRHQPPCSSSAAGLAGNGGAARAGAAGPGQHPRPPPRIRTRRRRSRHWGNGGSLVLHARVLRQAADGGGAVGSLSEPAHVRWCHGFQVLDAWQGRKGTLIHGSIDLVTTYTNKSVNRSFIRSIRSQLAKAAAQVERAVGGLEEGRDAATSSEMALACRALLGMLSPELMRKQALIGRITATLGPLFLHLAGVHEATTEVSELVRFRLRPRRIPPHSHLFPCLSLQQTAAATVRDALRVWPLSEGESFVDLALGAFGADNASHDKWTDITTFVSHYFTRLDMTQCAIWWPPLPWGLGLRDGNSCYRQSHRGMYERNQEACVEIEIE